MKKFINKIAHTAKSAVTRVKTAAANSMSAVLAFNRRAVCGNAGEGYSQFISLSSKADCCMSFSNDQIMNFCIHQFLTTCCGVVHQPHKTEITISIRLEAVGLLKKSFQCWYRQKLHNCSRSFPNRDVADFDLHIDFARI